MNVDMQELRHAVEELRDELSGVAVVLDTPGADEVRRARDHVLGQIDDYVLPRLDRMEAPLLVVVGGSTGAGKSTLVNSLVGEVVSAAGVLRPTTTTPILVANPADLHWFEGPRILPDLPRLTGKPRPGDFGLYLLSDDDVPQGIALLDAPDVDSVVEANRRLASQLLAAADLWLFATTAARYADGVPWSFLQQAHERSAALALVLNRIPPEAMEEVPEHLRQMLRDEGLHDAPVLTIPEVALDDGLIPEAQLGGVKAWLQDLAADAERRNAVIRQTLEGAVGKLPDRVAEIAQHVSLQIDAGEELMQDANVAYQRAIGDVEEALSGGTLLRGEVLARWHEFVGTGDFMRNVQSAIGRARDRIGDVLFGRPPVDAEVRSEVGTRIESAVIAASDKALERVLDTWRSTPAGRSLITAGRVPTGSSRDLRERVDAAVRNWQGRVLELVVEQGQDKRTVGRALSLGVNATGAALMITVFAHTGGLTGGEVVVAGGTAAVSQRVLEAVFGDQAVRSLTAAARSELFDRLSTIFSEEAERFTEPVRASLPQVDRVDRLLDVVVRLRKAAP
jgi:hypothetical protein